MTPDEIKRMMDDVLKRHDAVVKKKAGLGGRMQAKRDELNTLLQEVRAAGFEPKTLAADRDKAQGDLESMLKDFNTKLTEVEGALATLESK